MQFSLSHHRFLWRQILELSSDSLEDDVISMVQDKCLEFSEEMAFVSHLFQLNEQNKKEILRTPHVVQATTACMERVLREKRSHHFKEMWLQTDQEVEPDQYKFYAEAFQAEELLLKELDKQRQFSLIDLL